NGCRPEFAAANIGAVYDGASRAALRADSRLSGNPRVRITGNEVPADPGSSSDQALLAREAMSLGDEADRCRSRRENFLPGMKAKVQALADLKARSGDLGCPSWLNNAACGAVKKQVASECDAYRGLLTSWHKACPLVGAEDAPAEPENCAVAF